MNRYFLIGFLLFTQLFLVACGGRNNPVGEILGLNRRAPDEFLVISQPSLALPPDFTLSPTAESRTTTETDTDIQGTIFGTTQTQTETPTESGSIGYLLQRTGATNASDEIRRIIDVETSQLIEEDKNFVEQFLGTGAEFGNSLDASEEYQRLQNEGVTQ